MKKCGLKLFLIQGLGVRETRNLNDPLMFSLRILGSDSAVEHNLRNTMAMFKWLAGLKGLCS